MEDSLYHYEEGEQEEKAKKLLSYGELPLKKVMKKSYDNKEIPKILNEVREEFFSMFKSLPTVEKGCNRNIMAASYLISFLKVNKKRGYPVSVASEVILDTVDIGISLIPSFIIKKYVTEYEMAFIKNIKSKGIRDSLKTFKGKNLELKGRRKRELINSLILRENVKEFSVYLEPIALL
ncbi:hypothetical protein [Clostridium hydrogeniformans]|uniref:hypothetical protein n=1 Tax=Clostridium hydrogeniformans TaxID=349933 RepID=UPI0004827088|nr:hypothetical protein [Clostridium hydrogeniformans]